ncbi:HutD/Ves family protein [Undibacterium terreum]|uniref:HutD family protein n=1 Tax=Undibacterium terreum TaxID=1224302 RepID=A0A916UH87_9BURK|nr:hypothetical protein GCM10011396_20020 [Undibacterium terreum]
MPWKNGGGTTTELAISPAGATLDNFDWRISTALVASSGPFSQFVGIDRSLAVLPDGVLGLRVGDAEAFELDSHSEPFVFRGEQRIYALLGQNEINDFNVMTRRDKYSHELQRLSGSNNYLIRRQGQQVLLYCASGSGTVRHAASVTPLRQGDMLAWDELAEESFPQLECSVADMFYLVHLTANKD